MKHYDSDKKPASVYSILNLLLECAEMNAGKKPGGHRFIIVIKELGFLIFSLGGLQLYEIFSCSENFPLPSVSTIRRMIYSHECFTEGIYRISQLKDFLLLHKLPLKVFLCEDATRVTGKIVYHSPSNQVKGFALPLDPVQGIPKAGHFPALSASKIAEYFSHYTTSNNAYCIVAVPLQVNAPNFTLAMFGTDNKFNAVDVLHRYEWTRSTLKNAGIEVIGLGSDGDSRLLKCMIYKVIRSSHHIWTWFSGELTAEDICIQDHIHVGTKLKSCLLKPSVILPLGKNHLISRGHLVELIKVVSKDQHQLTESHINPKDKMNYRAVQLISSEAVTTLLRSHIHKSEGTAVYLDLMREVVEAYTRPDLEPLERVEMLWKWVFFLRIWRSWVEKQKGDYTLKNNFISSNSYACIEVNAHSLIQIIIKFRESEDHNIFLPWRMSSQPCENKFRRLRSVQKIFSISDIESNFRRDELLTTTYENLSQVIHLPRHHKALKLAKGTAHISSCLPENYEIEATVMKALQKAISIAKNFDLISNVPAHFTPVCHLKRTEMTGNNSTDELNDIENEDIDSELLEVESDEEDNDNTPLEEPEDDLDAIEDLYIISSGALGVKTFNNVNLSETSPFVLVGDGFGNPAIIRKSSFIWFLSSGDTRLSADRLVRVQKPLVSHTIQKSNKLMSPSAEEEINVGDWCAFEEDGRVVVGRVLSFSYLSGTTLKNQEYKRLSAPVKPPDKNARGLGCMCSWFQFKSNRVLYHMSMDTHDYFSVEFHLCTLPRPILKDNQLLLSCTPRSILQFKK